MRYLMPVILVTSMFLSIDVSAQTCTDKWKYKVVNLEDPEALIKKARKKNDAAKALKNALNALGDKGWELLSSHSVVEIQELPYIDPSDEEPPSSLGDWVYRLDPLVALFKRRTTTCE